jgi:septal ring factor EnvC (AmiA/AmiB activator)
MFRNNSKKNVENLRQKVKRIVFILLSLLSLNLLLCECKHGTLERDNEIKRLNAMIETLTNERENLQLAFNLQEDINFKLEKEKKEIEKKARSFAYQFVACRDRLKKIENIEESKG